MATFANVTPQRTVTTEAAFIPELWSDEIIASYEKSLVLANLIKKISMKGKKGDTLHVPKPVRMVAPVAKVKDQAVTVVTSTATDLAIEINQHFELSFMIEDIAETQALSSMRRFYTEDAGYGMAKHVDTALFNCAVALDIAGSPTTAELAQDPTVPANWVSANTTFMTASGALTAFTAAGTPTALTEHHLRAGLQKLDDNDVPMSGRFWVIPPSAVNAIRGINNYNSSDFVNFKQTSTGEIGNLYGVPIYVSTNVPAVTTTAPTATRMSLLAHRDCYVLAEQIGVRTQSQYKQEHLSTLLTCDRLYGRQVYRKENAIVISLLA
jgi:N4-gp56 family major capsid protein